MVADAVTSQGGIVPFERKQTEDKPMKVLMVCLGNICRSPLAEGVLKYKARAAALDWQVDSAGTGDWHIGAHPHAMSQKVALSNGIDISRQRARQFVKEDLHRYDLIYFMDVQNMRDARRIAGALWEESKCRLLMNECRPGASESIPDPCGHPEERYEEVFRMLQVACDRVIEKYGRGEHSPS